MSEVIARIAKTDTAELRVTRSTWKSRQVIDIRVWYLLHTGDNDFVPSRKGLAFDASKLPELIKALSDYSANS